MSIALPPPITPQLGSAVELRGESLTRQRLLIDYQGVHIHVFGDQLADADLLRRAVAAAANLSDAVRSIGYVQYVSGYPATLVTYAMADTDQHEVYVRVVPGRVRDVTGPADLLPYFSDLKGSSAPLTNARLEADRALADGVTERGGESYKPVFTPVGGDEVTLDLGAAAPGERKTSVLASFGNYGNRYAGPYLANAALRQSFSSGDELSLSGAADVRALGLGGAHSEPYHEGDGGWSKVTPFGVFGLQGRYADFSQTVLGLRFNGTLESGNASWLYPLYSDFQHRLNLQGRFERNHEVIEVPATTKDCAALGKLLSLLGLISCPLPVAGGEVLTELYNSVELNLNYVARMQHGAHQAELKAGLALRKGLGPHHAAGSAASFDYFLWQPSFSARYALSTHWSVLADGSFQLSNNILPQQQKFVIGGPSSLHAYQTGVGIGDHGENLSLGVEWKDYDDSWTEHYGIRPRGFVEYGSTKLEYRALGQPTGTVAAADAGAAVDLRFTPWLGGSLSLAQSIYSSGGTSSPDGLAKKYVFFQVAAKY